MTSRRPEMLEAALEMFAQRGFDGTSIAELAEVTGLSKAAFSYHFSSKDEILVELADPLIGEMERLVAAHEEVHGPEPLETLLAAYVDVLLHHRQVVVWIDGDKSVTSHRVVGARLEQVNAAMRRIITGGDPDPEAEVRASSVLGAIWRPIRNLTDTDVSEYRSQILAAARALAS